MIDMQQESFAAVEKSEAEKIVVKERQLWTDDDVDQTEVAVSLRDCDLRSRRRITIHVVNVATQGRVGIVNERVLQPASWAVYLDCWMRAVFFELACAAPNQTQLGIGIKAAVLDPAAKKEIFARNPKTRKFVERAVLARFNAFPFGSFLHFAPGVRTVDIREITNPMIALGSIHLLRKFDDLSYLVRQLQLQRFIGIQLQHPVA